MDFRKLFTPLFIISLIVLIVIVISLIVYTDWFDNPLKILALIGIAIAAVTKVASDLTKFLLNWRELSKQNGLDASHPSSTPTFSVTDERSLAIGETSEGTIIDTRDKLTIHGDQITVEKFLGDKGLKLKHFHTDSVSGDKLVAQTIIIQKEGKETRVPLQLPPRPEHGLRGRETELQILLDDLQPGKIVTLCGPGGIGKTALASEAIWHLTDNGAKPPDLFPDGVLFHSFYNQPEANLALEQIALTFDEDPRPTPEAAARRVLSNRCTLIILDGAEAADNLDKLVDIRSRNTVLITSSNSAHLIDIGQELSPLDLESAITLLKDWGDDQVTSDDHAHRICTLVDGLPLAVRLAGRFLAVHKDDIAEYASWLEKSPLAALDHGKRRLESVPILLERNLEYVSEGARETLAVIGHLGFAPFDRNLIYSTFDVEPQLISGWLNELLQFGLLLRDGEFYQVSHVLIRVYARERLHPPETSLTKLSQALMDIMDTIDVDRYPMKCIPFHPHLRVLAQEFVTSDKKIAALLWSSLGYSLNILAFYATAKESYVQALAIRKEVQGEKHPDTASSLNNLGALLSNMGDYSAAQPYFEQALAIKQEVLGEKHPDTASSLNNLGVLLDSMGDYSAARPYYDQALAIRKEVLGEMHPDTANSLNSLGALLNSMGDYSAAQPYFEQALAIRKEVLGEKHPDTASSLNNLGALLDSMGDYSAARSYYDQALAIRKEVLGEKHPDTANSLNNLGALLDSMGDYSAAQPYFEQALAIFEECLPSDHPNIQSVRDNLKSLEDQS